MDPSSREPSSLASPALAPAAAAPPSPAAATPRPVEHGGRRANASNGLEPTRFGDWEKDGRCIDF